MINALANHLWQSTLFAAAAVLLAIACRGNRARVRYRLWLCASLKFLVPFTFLFGLGSRVHWDRTDLPAASVAVSSAVVQIGVPFEHQDSLVSPQPTNASTEWIGTVAASVWLCGLFAVAAMRWRAWSRVRALMRAGHSFELNGIRTPSGATIRKSSALLSPSVVGWLRPVLLLPEDIETRLSRTQFEAVLAHEFCHIRSRDNLFSAIHMFVEAIFWFHPIVWFIGARLVDERERACDEEVLRLGNDPSEYAEGILNVYRAYAESSCRMTAGITGAALKKRIRGILQGSGRELNVTNKVALAATGMIALTLPIGAGMLRGSQSPFRPFNTPQWETVSVKPCAQVGGRGSLVTAPSNVAPTPRGNWFPGRLHFANCRTIESLVRFAYLLYGEGQHNNPMSYALRSSSVRGIPAELKSDGYEINAKAEGTPSGDMMQGPMLQTILEDRFKLRLHRETVDIPVYELTVAKGGPKLKPFQEGSCVLPPAGPPPEPGQPSRRVILPEGQKYCPLGHGGRKGNLQFYELPGNSLDSLAEVLSLDRPVINKTGIAGLFDLYLEYTPGDERPDFIRPDEPAGPSIFTALQDQLGLKLVTAKGPGTVLVVDHVERPKPN
jgi:uncharacterized protein (TIGR03435 family)